ncbi:hypothetical protein BDW74DRAFT_164972 [Aspergillus multicolor]|uniref:uncharacterized protein n=1 Tax=Aspergillus multicolor TaxID=41759 RepID=UPI003CCDBC8F
MARSRQPARLSSEAPSESSSSTSPERAADDDTDFFTLQANDSQSSIGAGNVRDSHIQTDPEIVLPPIAYLPPEILISIFSKLNSPKDLLSCLLRITAAVGEEDSFFLYSALIKRLNLSALTEDVSDGTVVPFAQCNRIERLTLTNCRKLTDNGVSDLIVGSRHLQALDVSELRALTDHTLFNVAENCNRLQGLNITGCTNVTDESLIAISQKCRLLKRLKLNGVTQVTDRAILSFAQNCASILEIDLQECKLVTNQSVTALMATLQNLRELRLAHCEKVDDSAFLDLPRHVTMSSLRILDLTACENIRDDAVERIVNAAPRLRNLVLAKCKFITDRSVWTICKLGKNLHYVHLGHCSNITDNAVIQLVKSCNRIRYIDLACCSRLTDRSVQQLATLPKLRRIGLVKCQLITDASILALARPTQDRSVSFSSLERVHLSYCINLTMLGIHALLNSCPRLTHLSLTGVASFLREELTVFCREAPQEFTRQQRDVFCVFSGEGVNLLRDHLNREAAPQRDMNEATMYDDEDELDEDEGQHVLLSWMLLLCRVDFGVTEQASPSSTGLSILSGFCICSGYMGSPITLSYLLSAMGVLLAIGTYEGVVMMDPPKAPRANPIAFTPWPVTLITAVVYLAFVIPLLVVHHVVPPAPSSSPDGLNITEAWSDLQILTSGYRPYNSRQNDKIHEWLLQRIDEILDAAPAATDEKKPDVFVFDDMRSNLTFTRENLAVYFEGTNILVYIRGEDDDLEHWWELPEGTPKGKGGVLVNAHYDSVSTGYGATDDGVGVVTCLQLVKYFTTPGHAPRKGLVVLFNNGEEDFLNGARVYSQHPLSRLPHTFLNLEGAGAGGRAVLFRSSDAEVSAFYMRSQHPFGSVLGSDGFKAGLIRSQTDYVVFDGDLGLRGLDVAFMEPRARYHTDQDDTRHTSKDSLWHMLSTAVATTEGLVSDSSDRFDGPSRDDHKIASGTGNSAVWFDLYGSTFVLFRLHTLFALSVTLLVVAPLVLLLTSIILTKFDKMYLFRTSVRPEGSLETLPLYGDRGLIRYPFLLGVPTAVTVGLAYLLAKVNPYIVHSSQYAVWSMMVSAWTFLAWFVSRVADFARPSAFHRVYTLTWTFVFMWVLQVIATVYQDRWGLGGSYFIFFGFAGTFLATWISYLELFSLPRKSERASSHGSRLGALSDEDGEDDEEGDEPPTESTSLLGSNSRQRTTFANYVRVSADPADHSDTEERSQDVNVYGLEQRWSASLPKWLWVLQFLLVAPIVLILVGPISLLLTSSLHQTGQDGSSSLFIYIAIVVLTTLLLAPILPFVHRYTYHIPIFLLAVFVGTLIYNLVAFPFSDSSRLKLFFIQEVDLDTGLNTVSLTGAQPFVHDVAVGLPSAAGQNVTCDPLGDRFQCSWTGIPPHVLTEEKPYEDWLSFEISRSTDKPRQAQLQITGQNTRACKVLFDTPIKNFHVADSAYDPRFPHTYAKGIKEIRLWSRTWDNTWTVDVEWFNPDSSSDHSNNSGALTGQVICIWSDYNQPGAIPALEEVRQYGPAWIGVSKLADGLVAGHKAFEIA